MGDKGGKKNKEKSQKQSSDKHQQKEDHKHDKQQKDKDIMELPADKTTKRKTVERLYQGHHA